jgi:hypothetical protein
VHFEKLIIEAEKTTFSLPLHARFTVVAGVGRLERDGLINELVSAVGSGRAGVHLDLVSDAGTRYSIVRPVGSAHRVTDTDRDIDVTDAFLASDGTVNLLDRAGLNERAAKRQMRLTPADLATASTQEEYILTMAHIEQGRLWDVAWKVKAREDRLNEVAEANGSRSEDLDSFEAVERRHRVLEEALAKHERVRRMWLLVGGICAIGSFPAAVVLSFGIAVSLILAAVATTLASVVSWRQLERARRQERHALAQAGAQSYLNFQVNRVNGLVADDQHRRAMLQAAEFHRAAMVEWQLLAGDVPVDWAIGHRREVRQAATKLRSAIGGVRNPMATTMTDIEEATADIGHTMLHRLSVMRTLGTGDESFPAFFDEPFAHLEPASKPRLLELLVTASSEQQIVYLTEDPDVIEWARVESLAGQVAIVEPGEATLATVPPAGAGRQSIPKRSRHVAA